MRKSKSLKLKETKQDMVTSTKLYVVEMITHIDSLNAEKLITPKQYNEIYRHITNLSHKVNDAMNGFIQEHEQIEQEQKEQMHMPFY